MDLNGRRNTYFHIFMLLFPQATWLESHLVATNQQGSSPPEILRESRQFLEGTRPDCGRVGFLNSPWRAFWVSLIGMWTTKCWVGGFKLYGYVGLLIWLRNIYIYIYIYIQYTVIIIKLLLLLLYTLYSQWVCQKRWRQQQQQPRRQRQQQQQQQTLALAFKGILRILEWTMTWWLNLPHSSG